MKNVGTSIDELSLTKQRKVVLQEIRGSDDHLTANAIFENAKQLLPSISFATAYNSVRYLKGEGYSEKNFGSGATRFDRMTSRHDHALCIECES